MKFAEYLAQTLPETTIDHLNDLREQLYGAGLVKKMEQATLTTEAAKRFALEWYRASLKETDKGYYGKVFEVTARVMWSIYHNTAMAVLDFKARPAGVADMRIVLNGKRYEIELKTGTGNLAQGASPQEALLKLDAVPKPDDAADAVAIALCHARSSTSLLAQAQQRG